jgi:hypothetical protein
VTDSVGQGGVLDLIEEVRRGVAAEYIVYDQKVLAVSATQRLLSLGQADRRLAVLALFDGLSREADVIAGTVHATGRGWINLHWNKSFKTNAVLIQMLLRKDPGLGKDDWVRVLSQVAKFRMISMRIEHEYLRQLVSRLERAVENDPSLATAVEESISSIAEALTSFGNSEEGRHARRLLAMIGAPAEVPLERGEAWSDRVFEDLGAMTPERSGPWVELIGHAREAAGSAPTGRWIKGAKPWVEAIGSDGFRECSTRWFALVEKPRTAPLDQRAWRDHDQMILEHHMDVLKGLCWIAGTFSDPEMARSLSRLALTSYKKVPGVGPRAVRVGNAAVYALGQMPGRDALGLLAMLRVKVKFGTAQKVIEKALGAAAEREGLPREEVEELAGGWRRLGSTRRSCASYGLGTLSLCSSRKTRRGSAGRRSSRCRRP